MDNEMDNKYTPILDNDALIAANTNNITIFEKKEDGGFKEVTENKDNFRQGLFTKKEVENQESSAQDMIQSGLTSEPPKPINQEPLNEPVLNSNEGTKTTTTKEVIPGVTKQTSKLLFSLANDPNAINEIAEVITKHKEQNETTASGTSVVAAGGRRRTKHKKGGKKSHKKGKSSKKVAKRRKSRKTGTRRSRKQNKH